MSGTPDARPAEPAVNAAAAPAADPAAATGASAATDPAAPSAGAAPARTAAGRLVARFEQLIRELGKFGVVGALTYVVDTALLKAGLSAGLNPLLAKTLSTVVAATLAFLGNRFWTWRDRPRSGLRREYVLYFLFNVVGLAIGLACLGISHYLLGRVWPVFTGQLADLVSANVFGVGLGTLFRFWSYRRFVFPIQTVTVDRSELEGL